MLFLLLLILPAGRTQESTPSSLLGPRDYNHHPFNAVQFVQAKSIKKGPILFPNDAPPPPPTPLIVTSRPLSESIAKSELNPNNSQEAQSQVNHVSLKPDYLARVKNYQPFSYTLATVTPLYNYDSIQEPYEEKKVHGSRKDSHYTDFEKRLMESIHRRKNTHKEDNLWDRPIYRRRIKQEHTGKFDARKTIFSDKEKSVELKVSHGSLYSREANEHKDVPGQIFRRMNYEDNKIRKRIPYYNTDSESDSYYTVRKNRPLKNMETYNEHRKRRPFPKPNSLSDIEDTKMDRREKRERHLQRVKQNIRENFYKSKFKRPHRIIDSFSDIEDNTKEERLFRKPTKDKIIDNVMRNKKTRPLQKLEFIDNKIRKPFYKTEDHKKSAYSSKIINSNENRNTERRSTHGLVNQKRATHSVDNLSHEYTRNKENKPAHRTENNKSKDRSIKDAQQEPSEEMIKLREIRPLYAFSDHYNHVDRTTPNPYRYKSEEKSPDYSNYYYTNEADNDASKDYNHGDNYAFSYTVKDQKTGDDFSHSQHSRGSATNGEYRVRLPDGRMQIVSYTADENGYKADVRYDKDHHLDNSIDVDTTRENGHHKNYRPIQFKNNFANDHFDSQYFAINRDYEDQRYKNGNTHNLFNKHTSQPSRRPTVARNKYQYQNPVNDPAGYTYDNTGNKNVDADADDLKEGSITDSNNDYLEHYKDKKIDTNERGHETDYFLFSDEVVQHVPKEIIDYSSELNEEYRPHTSKFSTFNDENTVKPTVKPSYEELKDLFVSPLSRRQQNGGIPVVSTAKPVKENVVVIGAKKPKLYTNIREAVPVTSSPLTYSTPFASTPSSYLFSTIANLKNQVDLVNKPVLSSRYIDKINKYLSFK